MATEEPVALNRRRSRMTPATATRPKKTTRKVRFAAEGKGAIVTMENQDEVVNQKGIKTPIAGTGKRIVFEEDGFGGQFYETNDEAEIDFLRQRANMFGVIKEVPIPAPPSATTLKQVVKLLGKGDVE